MKICHVIQRYRPALLTGSEQATVILCESLAKQKGLNVQVVTSDAEKGEGFYDPRSPRFAKKEEHLAGVVVTRLPVDWFSSSISYSLEKFARYVGLKAGDRFRFLAFGPSLVGLDDYLLAEQPDAVHAAPMPLNHVWQSWQICRRYRIPFIVTPSMHFDDRRFDNRLIYTILADADAVIAHSQFEKKALVKRGLDALKITVIPSSYLSPNDFKVVRAKSHGAPRVLFMGSKSFDKGTLHLLKVWPRVRAAVPNAELIIAGVSTESWQEGKKGQDMTGVTEFDYIDEADKPATLSGCDILCIPSRSESFGIVVLEAWAKGRPVIGGSAGATRELIDEGVNGYTVDFGDTQTLYDRIVSLLSDRCLATRLGAAGRKKALHFSEPILIERTLAVYREAIRKYK